MRETVEVPPDVRAHCERLLAGIDYEGYAEVEFRRDAEGQARLMEINPRLPGSLELSLRAGIDFVRLQTDWLEGRPAGPPPTYKVGKKLSWPRGELVYLLAGVTRRPQPAPTWRALGQMVLDYAPPPGLDNLDPRDPLPTLATVGRFASAPTRRLMKKVASTRAQRVEVGERRRRLDR